jgi:CTP synthase (UTP-ammonia lyase)
LAAIFYILSGIISRSRNEEKKKMKRIINVGVLGDFDPNKVSHPATNDAIHHAAKYLAAKAKITWISTPSLLTAEGQKSLAEFDCLWASSGSPYQSAAGMLKGIRITRELDRPFIGT